MREIKFRGWDKYRKEMYEVRGFSDNFITLKTPLIISGLEVNTIDIRQVELMQYAGSKDKNGKEIYESDVFTCLIDDEEFTNVVEWDENDDYIGWNFNTDDLETLEVIGNIYENPELIR